MTKLTPFEARLDERVLSILKSVEGINEHLKELNGQVAKNTEGRIEGSSTDKWIIRIGSAALVVLAGIIGIK